MAAKTDVAGRRVAKKGEPALAAYADKDITPVITEFVDWLVSETGYKVDPLSVQLGAVLRSKFQKSDVNQKRIAARAAEIVAEEEAREARAIDRAEKKAAKEAAAKEKAAQPKAAPAAKTAKTAKTPAKAPAKAAAKPATKVAAKPAVKATATTRRRPATNSKAAVLDSDF